MTRMLASVLDADEAETVLTLGADTVDLNDSTRGSLGAVSPEIARAAVARVAGRAETSAALGGPPYDEQALLERARAFAAAGVEILRLAVDAPMLSRLNAALRALASEAALAGMLFADEAPDFAVLGQLAALGFRGAMLDTRDKTRGPLRRHLDPARLDAFCRACRDHGLSSGVAGSLEAPDVPRLLLVRPDVLGFRGALCHRRDRAGAIDPQAVRLIRDLIPRERPEAASTKIDWRLMARGMIGGRDRDEEIEHVFVRDFGVMAEIGAYDEERGRKQRIVFDVEAEVRRASSHLDDMRTIFSYDVMLDAIRLAVARGHVDFVETLAEHVAAAVLQHRSVRAVRVSVRKLDVIDGAVGVEIRRDRGAVVSAVRPSGSAARD